MVSIPFEGTFYFFLSHDITSLWKIVVSSQCISINKNLETQFQGMVKTAILLHNKV